MRVQRQPLIANRVQGLSGLLRPFALRGWLGYLGFRRFLLFGADGVEALLQRVHGRIGMGFDAPPKTGDDRNRERINIVAGEKGGACLRFLDRRTLVAGFLRLDANNQLWLEFLDVGPTEVVTRRIGFKGEETTRTAR